MTDTKTTLPPKAGGLELTVLVDNNTLTQIDADLRGEPGLSLYIQCGGRKILFDTGYSDLFIQNAEKMGIDLREIDTVIHAGHCTDLKSKIALAGVVKLEEVGVGLKLRYR